MDALIDFFISYTGKDKTWAEWIAWTLEEAGYKTMIQAWDFHAASNFVLKMHQGMTETERTIAVISPDYFEAAFTNPEWAVAFANDPTSEKGKLISVRVADFKPAGVFKTIVYINLVGLVEADAKKTLTDSISNIVKGTRMKPETKPAFPVGKSSATAIAPPSFPGASSGTKNFLNNLPFSPNPFFTGRDQMLDDLHTALCKKTAAAITQPQAVHGLGGVGKTQLAIEYAWRHQADYDVVLWAGVATPTELHANLASLADKLGLPEADERDQETKVQAVLDWLRSNQRWLLILDNADTREVAAAINILLPPGLRGNVIVTSRRVEWPIGFADLEVSVLPELAAAEFLQHRTSKPGFNPGNESDALAIAKELGCLPLALEQAGAYVVKHRVNFAEYLKRWTESHKKLLAAGSLGGTNYKDTVATTWLVSELQLSLVARMILQLTAFLAPQDIPRKIFANSEELLSNARVGLMGDTRAGSNAIITEEEIESALSELHEYSLIKLEPLVISCHRLLQSVLVDRLEPVQKENWLEAALELIGKAAKNAPPPHTNWQLWGQLRPSIESVLQQTKATKRIPEIPFLMITLGDYYKDVGVYSEAEPWIRKAVDARSALAGDISDVMSYKLSLADLLFNLAKFDEAEKTNKEIISVSEQGAQIKFVIVWKAISNLASIEAERDHFQEAEVLFKKAIVLIEKEQPLDPVYAGGAINNLATLMTTTRRYPEAEKLFRRSLEILEKHRGEDDFEVAAILGNMARCLHEQANLNKGLHVREWVNSDKRS